MNINNLTQLLSACQTEDWNKKMFQPNGNGIPNTNLHHVKPKLQPTTETETVTSCDEKIEEIDEEIMSSIMSSSKPNNSLYHVPPSVSVSMRSGGGGGGGGNHQGDHGDMGEKGEKGIKGERGDMGEQGVQGLKGMPGLEGEKGKMGKQGEEGPQGVQGPQGLQGPTGIQGNQGPRGIQGMQGEPGTQGEPGMRGAIEEICNVITNCHKDTIDPLLATTEILSSNNPLWLMQQKYVNTENNLFTFFHETEKYYQFCTALHTNASIYCYNKYEDPIPHIYAQPPTVPSAPTLSNFCILSKQSFDTMYWYVKIYDSNDPHYAQQPTTASSSSTSNATSNASSTEQQASSSSSSSIQSLKIIISRESHDEYVYIIGSSNKRYIFFNTWSCKQNKDIFQDKIDSSNCFNSSLTFFIAKYSSNGQFCWVHTILPELRDVISNQSMTSLFHIITADVQQDSLHICIQLPYITALTLIGANETKSISGFSSSKTTYILLHYTTDGSINTMHYIAGNQINGLHGGLIEHGCIMALSTESSIEYSKTDIQTVNDINQISMEILKCHVPTTVFIKYTHHGIYEWCRTLLNCQTFLHFGKKYKNTLYYVLKYITSSSLTSSSSTSSISAEQMVQIVYNDNLLCFLERSSNGILFLQMDGDGNPINYFDFMIKEDITIHNFEIDTEGECYIGITYQGKFTHSSNIIKAKIPDTHETITKHVIISLLHNEHCILKYSNRGHFVWNTILKGNADDNFKTLKICGNELYYFCKFITNQLVIENGDTKDVIATNKKISILSLNKNNGKKEFIVSLGDSKESCIKLRNVVCYKKNTILMLDGSFNELMVEKNNAIGTIALKCLYRDCEYTILNIGDMVEWRDLVLKAPIEPTGEIISKIYYKEFFCPQQKYLVYYNLVFEGSCFFNGKKINQLPIYIFYYEGQSLKLKGFDGKWYAVHYT